MPFTCVNSPPYATYRAFPVTDHGPWFIPVYVPGVKPGYQVSSVGAGFP